tara:strand:- start:95 stop:442 length:348 start_codon:yes stop_codon:yes gene_type:complete
MFKNLDSGLTRDRYFEMQEQMGLEPEEDRIPPDMEDLPELCHIALGIYNRLGDRVYPEIGYIGKDYTKIGLYMKVYDIEKSEEDFLLQIIEWYDSRAIKQSADQLKREYAKLKRK